MVAIEESDKEMVEYLIRNNCNLTYKNEKGEDCKIIEKVSDKYMKDFMEDVIYRKIIEDRKEQVKRTFSGMMKKVWGR